MMFEDFWSRQQHEQTERFETMLMGIPVQVSANQPDVMKAVKLSVGRFNSTAEPSRQSISIKIVVQPRPAGPAPGDLPDQMTYAGVDRWITLSAGVWGHGIANLATREAVLFLSPELARDIRLVSRYFVDHYLLNFILTEWAMLHASCVLTPDRHKLIIMIAAHNTGKSTTALNLLRAGFPFLADGMALLRKAGSGFEVGGYPVGEVKLRDDVLEMFPAYQGRQVQVREHTKTVVELRQIHSADLITNTIRPSEISLCFLSRKVKEGKVRPAREVIFPEEAQALLAGNSVYWDEPARLAHNQVILQALVERASLYRVWLGQDVTRPPAVFAELL
jgi:hypothetical protein